MDHSDLSLAFVDSCCYTSEGLWVSAKELWLSYREWSVESHLRCLRRKDLLSRLSVYFEIGGSPQVIYGLVLRDPEEWEWFDPSELRKVYLISNGKHTKIGVSVDPPTRMEILQIGSSAELTLVGSWLGGYVEESKWHRRFHDKRIRGEWFDLSPEDIREVLTAVQ